MARFDYRSKDHNVTTEQLLKAALAVLVKEINVLRQAAGLQPLTAAQIKEKLRQELLNQ